jgi:hypothetical protein
MGMEKHPALDAHCELCSKFPSNVLVHCHGRSFNAFLGTNPRTRVNLKVTVQSVLLLSVQSCCRTLQPRPQNLKAKHHAASEIKRANDIQDPWVIFIS